MAAALNPLRCSETELPPHLLLTAKLLTVLLLLQREVSPLGRLFLPFIRALDALPPAAVHRGLQGVFLLAAMGLLFNYRARLCCVVLGGTLLASVLSSRLLYANNLLYVAALLFMIGLEPAGTKNSRFLRWQIATVYAGAALNKLLDADWRSGTYFDNFISVFHLEYLRRLSGFLPPRALAMTMSWTTIVTELSLSMLWLTGVRPRLTIWAVFLFHSVLSTVARTTFGNFYVASLISTLILVRPRASRAVVLYDGDCGICSRTRACFEALDFDRTMDWQPYQTAPDRRGLADSVLQERLHLVVGDRIYAGFKAFKEMVLLMPVSYFAVLLLFVPLMRSNHLLGVLAAGWGVMAVFFPPFESIGERAYLLIARNRRRLSGAASACGIHRGE
jgi:predicted DCC family thiol-disulfide oxidoreductase YuxK